MVETRGSFKLCAALLGSLAGLLLGALFDLSGLRAEVEYQAYRRYMATWPCKCGPRGSPKINPDITSQIK